MCADLRDRMAQIWERDVEPTELLLHAIAFVWAGGLLAFPDVFATGLAYRAMAALLTTERWAGVFAVAPAIAVVGYLRHSDWLRLVALVWHVGVFGFVAYMFARATPTGLGGPLYLLFDLWAAWVACRIAFDRRDALRADWNAARRWPWISRRRG